MYGSHSVSAPMNGLGGDLVDGSGTINPAALNNANGMSPSFLSTPHSFLLVSIIILSQLSRRSSWRSTVSYFLLSVHRDDLQTDPPLVSVVLPTQSYGAVDPSTIPRGIKRGRTPEQRGPSRDGEHDDGMCVGYSALGTYRAVGVISSRSSHIVTCLPVFDFVARARYVLR
jgi:hypothetical protein